MISLNPHASDEANASYLFVIFALGGAIFLVDLLAIIYCYLNRNYAPIKAKNIHIMSISLLAAILFWVGIAHSFGIFGWEGVWRNCSTLRVWAEFPFGVQLFLFVLCYRLLVLYRLLILHRKSSNLYRVGVVLVVFVPILTGYAVFELTNQAHVFHPRFGCIPSVAWGIYGFLVVLVGILSLAWLTFALRKTPSHLGAFHEYSDTRYGGFVLTFVYVVVSCIFFSGYYREFVGQVVILALLCFTVNFYFWVVLFRPIYDSLFRRDKALREFYATIGTTVPSNNMSKTITVTTPATDHAKHQSAAYDDYPPYAYGPTYPRETYQQASSPTYNFPNHTGNMSHEYMFTAQQYAPRQSSPPPPRPPPRRGNYY